MFVNPACWHKQNYAYLTLPTKQQNAQALVTTAIRERKNLSVKSVCFTRLNTVKSCRPNPTQQYYSHISGAVSVMSANFLRRQNETTAARHREGPDKNR